MNLLNHTENEFEKVVVTNSFYTIFETKAFISFKKGDRFQFTFDEISNIRIVKKEKNIFTLLFLLFLATITCVFFSLIETNTLYQFSYLGFSYLFFILTFYVKKTSYTLCIDKKNLVRHRFTIKKELLGDVKFFVQTIREIKYKKSKKQVPLTKPLCEMNLN